MQFSSTLCPRWSSLAAVLLGLSAVGAGDLAAQTPSFNFNNLADLNTAAPGQGSNFTGFFTPSFSGGVAVFSGFDGGYAGVFTSSVPAGPAMVVDNTMSPAGHGTFSSFTSPTISGGNVAFAGAFNAGASGSGGSGIYTASRSNPGVATAIVENGQTVPGGTATFGNFATPDISGNNVVFYANSSSNGSGFYQGAVGSATVTTIADRSTPQPGQNGTFRNFNQNPTISGVTSAFYGRVLNGTAQGIYTSNPVNGLQIVVDSNSPVPFHAGLTFTGITPGGTGVISGNYVAFHALFSGGEGYYLGSVGGAGGSARMVELGEAAPRGGTFTGFGNNPAISGNSIIFDAVTNPNGTSSVGLFLSINGTLTEVINDGDALFGSTLSSFDFTPTAFDGNQIAFRYNLANGDQGIALVTVVPEPSTWVISALSLGLIAYAARRGRKAFSGR